MDPELCRRQFASHGTSTNDGAEDGALTPPTTDNNPWRFESGYTDANTGMLKFGTRYYIPQLARWTQTDPTFGRVASPPSLNSYLFVSDNPVNDSDASGRCGFLDLVCYVETAEQYIAPVVLIGLGAVEVAGLIAACATVVGCFVFGPLLIGGTGAAVYAAYRLGDEIYF